MYKKITHDIIEEHYEQPKSLPTEMKATLVNVGIETPLPSAVMTETTMLFRMDARTLWTKYSLGMVNFSVSDLANLEGTSKVEASLGRNSSAIGNYFTPYYGITSGTKIANLLTVMCKNGTRVVGAIKKDGSNADVAVYVDIWQKESEALAYYLNQLNPNFWPKDLLAEMFVNLTNFWIDDFRARADKDFAADAIALDNILKIAVIGIPDHARSGYSSIADIVSRGIISQFPLAFVA